MRQESGPPRVRHCSLWVSSHAKIRVGGGGFPGRAFNGLFASYLCVVLVWALLVCSGSRHPPGRGSRRVPCEKTVMRQLDRHKEYPIHWTCAGSR